METIQEAGKGERESLKRGLRASVRRQEANQSRGCLRQFSLEFTKLGGFPPVSNVASSLPRTYSVPVRQTYHLVESFTELHKIGKRF